MSYKPDAARVTMLDIHAGAEATSHETYIICWPSTRCCSALTGGDIDEAIDDRYLSPTHGTY